ncbi:hypothetical protein AB8U03_05830 [Clostridium sp. Mt-5]|uniref:Uncharacterized protein n=1 Tax=Clostridium moutaii TaxID=3240932 RepID=A0ABV4BQ22_9CLOT
MEIRPKPEMIINWAVKIGFKLEKQVELLPYHYGLIFKKDLKFSAFPLPLSCFDKLSFSGLTAPNTTV